MTNDSSINFPIENLSIGDLEDLITQKMEVSTEIKDLFLRHQYKYITRFFGDVICQDGRFVKNSRLSDLVILYHVDYFLKRELEFLVSRIERHLNVIILNLHASNQIANRTDDRQNTFSKIVSFYNDLNKQEQRVILEAFNSIHATNFPNVFAFMTSLADVVILKKFVHHHYSIPSFLYAAKIDNGYKYYEKSGSSKTLADVMHSLSNFLSKNVTNQFLVKSRVLLASYQYSSPQIGDLILRKMGECLNYAILEKNANEPKYFSIIDLIGE